MAHILVNIKSNPKADLINSFKTKLSIKYRNTIQISYKAILEIMFDNFLLRIDFQPFNLIDLKIPVKVSKTIAEPTAIKSP